MGYFKRKDGMKQSFEVCEKETVEDVLKLGFHEAKDRGIRKEVCKKFGIRSALSEKDGETVEAYYFPSYNQKGKLVGFMKQDVTKSKEEKGHWKAIGSVSISNKLFGQDIAEGIGRKRNSLVITEGQWDTVSTFQALVDSVKGTKYDGMEPFVVSIPLGTANAVEAILHNADYVKSYDSLCIFFDDDYTTPAEKAKGILKGHEAREAVAGALVGEGISLMTVSPDYGFKDASDYLQADKAKELAKLVQFEKRPYSAEKIVKASSVSLEQLMSKREQGVVVDCFPMLMQRLNGFRLSELSLLLAPSNVGKSTVCSILAHKFMQAGHKIGMIYLEEDTKDTLQRMIAAELKVNFVKFRRDPLSVSSAEDIERAYNQIAGQERLVMLDHFGSIPISDLMNKIKTLHLVEGCNYIVLDHISAVISGLQSDNERKDLDVVMTELASFCSANPVHIVVVSHINRSDSQQFLPPKGKEGESFWVNVRKESARGSAALEQFSWNILGLEPEINPDFSRGRVRLKVLKTRFGDSLGIADVFTLNHDTWEVTLDNQDGEVSF